MSASEMLVQIQMMNKCKLMLLLQIAQTLYLPYIEKVPLFRGCSSEFINQIVSLLIFLKITFFLQVTKEHTFAFITGYKTS